MAELTGDAPPYTFGEVRGLKTAVGSRRALEAVVVLAGTALFWSWLLMGASTVRTAVVMSCAAALLGVAVFALTLQLAAGKPEPDAVLRELGACSAVTKPLERLEPLELLERPALPGRLRGRFARYFASTMPLFLLLGCGLLPILLSLGEATPSPQITAIKKAGVDGRWLPVEFENVLDVTTISHKNGASYVSTVKLELPGTQGRTAVVPGVKTDDPVTYDDLYVAYAPSQPGLGAVADDDRGWVERALAGHTFYDVMAVYFAASVWGAVFLIWLLALPSQTGSRGFPRQLTGDEVAVRVRATRNKRNPQRYTLAVTNGKTDERVAFVTSMSGDRYFVLSGPQEGTLVWDPRRSLRKRKNGAGRLKANFIADAGWHFAGEIDATDAESAVRNGTDSFRVRADREAPMLEISDAWPLTMSRRTLWTAIGMATCLVALTLPVQLGAVRGPLGLLGSFGPVVGGLVLAKWEEKSRKGKGRKGKAQKGESTKAGGGS